APAVAYSSSYVRPSTGYRDSQAATFGSRSKMRSAWSFVCCAPVWCGTNGVWISRPCLSKTGATGGVVPPAARADGPAASASRATARKRRRLTAGTLRPVPPERPELVADEVERGDEDDRDRLADELARPGRDQELEQREVAAE